VLQRIGVAGTAVEVEDVFEAVRRRDAVGELRQVPVVRVNLGGAENSPRASSTQPRSA
jgi:hypothetical protein